MPVRKFRTIEEMNVPHWRDVRDAEPGLVTDTWHGEGTVQHGRQRGPQGLFTWVISGTSTAELRPVEVGTTTKDLAVITSGLREGERVVIGGPTTLIDPELYRGINGAARAPALSDSAAKKPGEPANVRESPHSPST